jgi:hypothetical protein
MNLDSERNADWHNDSQRLSHLLILKHFSFDGKCLKLDEIWPGSDSNLEAMDGHDFLIIFNEDGRFLRLFVVTTSHEDLRKARICLRKGEY